MKTLLVVLTILLASEGCKKNSNPANPNHDPMLSTSQVIDGVRYTLSVTDLSFGTSDTLDAVFAVTNQAATTRTFSFGNLQQFHWSFCKDTSSVVMYQPHILLPALSGFTLNPGETKTYAIHQAIRDENGATVVPGSYVIFAGLLHPNSALLTLSVVLH